MEFGLVHLIDPRLNGLVAESRAFYAQRVAGRGPSSPEELRTLRVKTTTPAPSDPPAVIEVLRTCSRSVPVRIHAPASGAVAGAFLEIHGGGFYLGSAAGSDVRNRALADALDLAVVSVDYRLAPEHLGLPRPTTARSRRSGSPTTLNIVSAPRSSSSEVFRPVRRWG